MKNFKHSASQVIIWQPSITPLDHPDTFNIRKKANLGRQPTTTVDWSRGAGADRRGTGYELVARWIVAEDGQVVAIEKLA